MEALNMAYRYLYLGVLIFLGCCLIAVLVRAIRGPRIIDRIVAANMAGSMTIACIAILSRLLEESWLLDVCLVYGVISFLATVVLSKVFLTVTLQGGSGEEEEK